MKQLGKPAEGEAASRHIWIVTKIHIRFHIIAILIFSVYITITQLSDLKRPHYVKTVILNVRFYLSFSTITQIPLRTYVSQSRSVVSPPPFCLRNKPREKETSQITRVYLALLPQSVSIG